MDGAGVFAAADPLGDLVGDRLIVEVSGQFRLAGADALGGKRHESSQVGASGFEGLDRFDQVGPQDGEIAARGAEPVHGAIKGYARGGRVEAVDRLAEQREDRKVRLGHLDLGPEDHLCEVIAQRLELRVGHVEVDLGRGDDGHVCGVEDMPLDVEVEGGRGVARGGVVKLLGEQIIKVYRGLGASDGEHAALRAVDDGGAVFDVALLHEGIAIMPGHALFIEEAAPLESGSAGTVKQRRNVGHGSPS